jgi:5-methylcytosine-specific restriction enzyme A
MPGGWQGSDRGERLPPEWRPTIRPRILARDRHRCQLRYDGCLGKATQVDHKIAGDDHSDANLQAVCEECHSQKSAREGVDARARITSQRRRPAARHPGLRS